MTLDADLPLASFPPSEKPHRTYEIARLRLARMRVQGGSSLREVFQRATELAAATLQVERAGVWLFTDEPRALCCCELYERSKNEHSEGVTLHAKDFPTYFRALEERRDIPAEEAKTHPLTHELENAYLAPLGIISMLDAPIFRDGQVIGVVCHEHVGPLRRWTIEERDFAGSVADMVALKFEGAARQDVELSLEEYQGCLVELHKMEALAQLAASVAHDFKNILTVVRGTAEMIQVNPEGSPQILAGAKRIAEAAERGESLAKDLLAFGRDDPQATRVIDVMDVVERFAEMLKTVVGTNCKIQLTRARPTGRVFMDPAQLERVVLNLVVNALDAMPTGGVIQVEVDEAKIADGLNAPEVYVILQVRDTGVGMDAQTRSHIFEPFFTTKTAGKGTGLGLAIVYRIVDRCGGFIQVDSEPGQGTAIRVYLPRVTSSHAGRN